MEPLQAPAPPAQVLIPGPRGGWLRPPFEPGNRLGGREHHPRLSDFLRRVLRPHFDMPGQRRRVRSRIAVLIRVAQSTTRHVGFVIAAREVLLMAGWALDSQGKPVRCALRTAIDRHGNAHGAGVDPEVGRALERVLDRLEGRPPQEVQIGPAAARPPADTLRDLADLVRADPEAARGLLHVLADLDGPAGAAGE